MSWFYFIGGFEELLARLIAYLLTVEAGRNASSFYTIGAIQAISLDISKGFWKGFACSLS